MTWQPIDCAPKDRPVLLFLKGYVVIRWIEGHWDNDHWEDVHGADLTPFHPSHWCDPGEPNP